MINSQLFVRDRVRLIEMLDEYTQLEPGAQGVVDFIDDLGTVHVKWDTGHTLGLIPELDKYERL